MTAETQQQKIAFFRLAIAVGILMLSGHCAVFASDSPDTADPMPRQIVG